MRTGSVGVAEEIGLRSQQPEARESGGGAPIAGRFLHIFSKNNAFLCIFRSKYIVILKQSFIN